MKLNKIDSNVWEFGGLWIEKSGGAFCVMFNNEYEIFNTLAAAIAFCNSKKAAK